MLSPWVCRVFAALCVFAICLQPNPSRAQAGALAEAQTLRARGEFAAAIRVLRQHVSARPHDGEAARMLAQTLYWNQEFDAARDVYESALQRHTGDQQVRLDYGEMLVATGDAARARAILAPMLSGPRAAPAHALLGTLAYHEGDFRSAARLYEQALRIDPEERRARAHLREIQAASAPWIRVAPSVWHDDQPLDYQWASVEGGWFLTPLTPISLRISPTRYAGNASEVGLWASEVNLRHSALRARIEMEVAAGFVRRTGSTRSAQWTGRGMLGIRASRHVTGRVRIERTPYLNTRAGLATRVHVDSLTAEADFNHPLGWMGRAAIARHRYPDGNVIDASFAWLLAPVVRSSPMDLHLGYGISHENAGESRFVLADPNQPNAPASPLFDFSGRYDPYYTPAHLLKHSLAGAVRGRPAARLTVRAGGSYAVRATDDAPVLFAQSGSIERTFFRRESHPFEARASLELIATDALSLGITGEVGRSAFYRWRRAGAQLTYRFHAGSGGGAR